MKSNIIDKIKESKDGYIIYSMLKKHFNFEVGFDNIEISNFGDSKSLVQYFGIDEDSSNMLYNNVEILFYNNEKDFAVKLNTKENEEIIIYRNDNNNSFNNLYNELLDKERNYNGNKMFTNNDKLSIPEIDFLVSIDYDEICGRMIKGSETSSIQYAIQTIEFKLDRYGGNLQTESTMGIMQGYKEEHTFERNFIFNDRFTLFLKEENQAKPYYAMNLDNAEYLKPFSIS